MQLFKWFKKQKNYIKPGTSKLSHGVGIALSGGGARGYAHIGVLKALSEHKIEPAIVSGTSMGSLIGVLYAAGFSPIEIQELVKKEPIVKMVKMAFGKHGFFEMSGVRKILNQVISPNDFSTLKKPFYLSVTNLNKGINEVKSRGTLIEYVIASCSVPVVFAPVEITGTTYVDGGLFDNLPAECIRDNCNFLIGVNVNPTGVVDKFDGIRDVAERSFTLSIDQNVRISKAVCNVVIEPPGILDFTFWDFDKVDKIVEVGYQYTIQLLQQGGLNLPIATMP